jgi:diguanylate cyclase (GGDEF)-like protein
MVMPEIKDVSKPIRHLILFDHAATARHFGAIEVFDATGKLTVDASTLDPLPENRAEEEYFTVHRDNPDAGLFISRPILHRGAYAIVLSRRITGPDGSFQGVVAGSLRFTYFHELFGRLQLGEGDTICVLRADRTIIMRRPFDLDVIGKKLGDMPRGKQPTMGTGSTFSGVGPVDDVARLYVRGASTSPLTVIVGKPVNDVFALWYTEAIRIGAIMTALIAFVLAVTLFLAREIRRRADAEDKLEELATTDALTGLKNRRKFDEAIDSEWRRARRHKTPLSLLMIDADHFKTYNDTYGHQAGDQVLVGIAICISDSVKRAGDCAVRYGGEEFAVLLPGTASADAMMIAETIRRKVQGWSDEPEISTVSVGIASVTPQAGTDWADFVNAADKALYAAKAAGRNCCVLAPTPVLSLVA